MSHDVGDSATTANSMASAKTLLVKISGLVEELSKLKNACAPVSVEVEAFLEKRCTSMGVAGPAAKNQKADDAGEEQNERACIVASSGQGGNGP